MLPIFGVRVSVTFHLTCVHIILVWFRLLSGHPKEIAVPRLIICSLLYFDYLEY